MAADIREYATEGSCCTPARAGSDGDPFESDELL
jgi:hypothetical protein